VPSRPSALLVALLVGGCGAGGHEGDISHDDSAVTTVVRIQLSPGMGSVASYFRDPPALVVTGDGTVFVRPEHISLGEDVVGVRTFHASELELQALLHDADDAGLLGSEPDYSTSEVVLDGGGTYLRLETSGGIYEHRGYALGETVALTGPRSRLQSFVGGAVGWARGHDAREYEPASYRVLVQAPGETDPHCAVAADPALVIGEVLAVAVSLPGDHCEDLG
jgi:hypothetical protein